MSSRRAFPVLLCCAIIACASYLVVAEDTIATAVVAEPEVQNDIVIEVPAGAISATAYAVFDLETGEILTSAQGDTKLPIASVTKLFSAAAALRHLDLDAATAITWGDLAAEGRAGKLAAGEVYSNRELLWPLLLESSNDAAAALERTNPTLIQIMNAMAEENGLDSMNFTDASGLSAYNVASAHDLAALVTALYKEEPHLFDITQLPKYVGEHTGWINNNPFIDDSDYRGGKHGFTYEAGRTGVLLFEEGERTLGYVLLGSDDLVADIAALRP